MRSECAARSNRSIDTDVLSAASPAYCPPVTSDVRPQQHLGAFYGR
jgi:hypothetical protein